VESAPGFLTTIVFRGLAWLLGQAGYTVLTPGEAMNIQDQIAALNTAVAAVAAAQAAEPGAVSDVVVTNVIAALPSSQPLMDAVAAVQAAIDSGQITDKALLDQANAGIALLQSTLGPPPASPPTP
jgi:hypothetical protein